MNYSTTQTYDPKIKHLPLSIPWQMGTLDRIETNLCRLEITMDELSKKLDRVIYSPFALNDPLIPMSTIMTRIDIHNVRNPSDEQVKRALGVGR